MDPVPNAFGRSFFGRDRNALVGIHYCLQFPVSRISIGSYRSRGGTILAFTTGSTVFHSKSSTTTIFTCPQLRAGLPRFFPKAFGMPGRHRFHHHQDLAPGFPSPSRTRSGVHSLEKTFIHFNKLLQPARSAYPSRPGACAAYTKSAHNPESVRDPIASVTQGQRTASWCCLSDAWR